MRRPVHDGQKPRPLQENATSRSCWHASQRKRAKPRASWPQVRNEALLALDELRQAVAAAARPRLAEERLEVLVHHPVQRPVRGRARAVAGRSDSAKVRCAGAGGLRSREQPTA